MARRDTPELGTLSGRRRSQDGTDVRGGGLRARGSPTENRGGGGARRLFTLGVILVLVVGVAYFIVPVVFGGVISTLAEDNPDLLRIPLVADSVSEGMAERIDQPAGTDTTPVEFVVTAGSSSRQITDDLVERELVTDRLAFSYLLITESIAGRLQAGAHSLNRAMSPRQVADELQRPAQPIGQRVTIALREGLRIEQTVAYLQTLGLEMNVAEFYELAVQPPDDLRAAHEWMRVIPAGKSLEGFLGNGVFEVPRDITPAELLEELVVRWESTGALDLIAQVEADGRDFYEVIIMASIVQREAILDEDRPLIAGVYQNRLDGHANGVRLLNAEPVVIYAKDLMLLRETPLTRWPEYHFWTLENLGSLADFQVTPDLAGYQVWHSRGLPPTPICTPNMASIQAAIEPDQEDRYIYFLAKGDGTNGHVFAHTYEEHLRNIEQYMGGGGSPTETP